MSLLIRVYRLQLLSTLRHIPAVSTLLLHDASLLCLRCHRKRPLVIKIDSTYGWLDRPSSRFGISGRPYRADDKFNRYALDVIRLRLPDLHWRDQWRSPACLNWTLYSAVVNCGDADYFHQVVLSPLRFITDIICFIILLLFMRLY